MKRRSIAKMQRTVAIKQLQALGMTDAEIEAELGYSLTDEETVNSRASNSSKHVDTERVTSEQIEEADVIDAEIVENLPAVVVGERDSPEPETREAWSDDGIERPEGYARQHDSALANNPERRCVATNNRGERCRKFAIAGSTVCRTHGGATRRIKEKARIRVEQASNRLMGKLIEIAFDDTRPAAIQLDAIKDSLNRAGLSKPAQVEVGPIKPYETVFDDIASGSRSEYRQGAQDDSPGPYESGQISHKDYSGLEDLDYPTDSPPAPVDRQRRPDDRRGQGDCDRLRATQADERPARDRDYRAGHHVTGDDAVRLANQANTEIGALRALPPGRSAQ